MALSEDQVRTWRGRIELAKRYQERFGDTDGRWGKHVRAMAGDFNSIADLGDEAIDVNLVHASNKTVLPATWLTEPHVTFRPTQDRVEIGGRSVDNIRRSEFAEAEVNYWLRELKVRTWVVKKCVLDAESTNHGYAYVGYIKDKSEIETRSGESTEPNPTVRLKRPFVRRLSPRSVLLQPGREMIEECEWICILWNKTLGDVRERYGRAADDVPTTARLLPDDAREDASQVLREYLAGDDAKLVEIQQVWDKRSKKILTLADGHDRVLREEDWTIEFDGFPVEDLSFVDVPDEYYGSPPMQYYYPQNKEQNAARTSMRKRFNRSKATIITSGQVGEDFKEAYASAPDGTVISTDLPGEQPMSHHILIDHGLPQDASTLAYDTKIANDFRMISGHSAEQLGGSDPNVDTATQSANIEKHVQTRAADRGDRVRGLYLGIARKLWLVLQQFPDEKRDRLIAGEAAGQFRRLRYTLKELRGEFALEMGLSTMMPETPERRQVQALSNYNLLRADPLVNPEMLILDLLRAQNTPNPEQFLLFLREPAEEFEMMLRGLPVEPHDRDRHERHVEAHEGQMEQVEAALGRLDPASSQGQRLRLALALLLAHTNAHERALQAIAAATGRQPGSPVSENLFRGQQAAVSGRETTAELTGQALATTPGGSS